MLTRVSEERQQYVGQRPCIQEMTPITNSDSADMITIIQSSFSVQLDSSLLQLIYEDNNLIANLYIIDDMHFVLDNWDEELLLWENLIEIFY